MTSTPLQMVVLVSIGIGVLAFRSCAKQHPDARVSEVAFFNPVYAPELAWERTNPAYDSAGDGR